MNPGQYKVTYTYYTRTDMENFAIMFGQGTDPENYTIDIMRKENYKNSNAVTESNTVLVSEAGEYRVALYAYSPANKYTIYIRNITIERIDDNMPLTPTAEMTSTGLEGLLSVTLPTANAGGNNLSGTVTATVKMDDSETPIATISGQPGQTIDVEVTVPKRGNHTFTLQAAVDVNDETLYSEKYTLTHLFTRVIPNPLPLDYVIAPDEDDMTETTVVNVNGDDRTWTLYSASSLPSGGVGPMAYQYNSSYSQAANDWLILPAYEGIESGMARLHMLVGTKTAKENFEIAVATEATEEAMVGNVVWQTTDFSTSDKFQPMSMYLPVPAGENFFIGIHCNSPESRGQLYIQNISVEASSPIVPKEPQFGEVSFDGGDGSIELIFPSQTLLNVDIEGTVKVALTFDGEPFGEDLTGTPGEVRTLTFTDLELGNYTITATAYAVDTDNERYDSMTASLTFRVLPGSNFFYTLPLDLTFNESVIEACAIFDVNADNNTWTLDSSGAVKIKFNSGQAADDWFITPGIQVDNVENEFEITFSVKNQSSTYHEKFEAYIGSAQNPEGMTIQIIEPTEVTESDYQEFSGTVTLPEAGRYYIGFHGISDKDKYYLYLKNIKMAEVGGNVGVASLGRVEAKAVGLRGAIRFAGMEGCDVVVSDLAGHVVFSGDASARTVPAAPGLYIVKAQGKTFKVIVR